MSGRIFWDDEEKRRIIDAVFAMRQNDPESSLIAIINRAQAQLPKDRRRSIPSVKSIPWIRTTLQAMFETQRKRAKAAEDAGKAAESATSRQQQLQGQLQDMVKKAKASALEEASIDDLLVELLGKFVSENDEQKRRVSLLEEKVNGLAGCLRNQPTQAPTTPAKKLPVILIVGLLNSQANNIRSHFRNAIDPRFINSDERNRGIPKADAAVLNTKFIPHDLQSNIQSKFAGTKTKVYLVSGGLTSMKTRIEEILLTLSAGGA